jgi:hypothetical protein
MYKSSSAVKEQFFLHSRGMIGCSWTCQGRHVMRIRGVRIFFDRIRERTLAVRAVNILSATARGVRWWRLVASPRAPPLPECQGAGQVDIIA